MVKHNNVIPNGHFHKDWQRRIKTWFDQVSSLSTGANAGRSQTAWADIIRSLFLYDESDRATLRDSDRISATVDPT